MKNNQVATYQISDIFKITGRGFALAGCILDGTISIGDYIEFSAFNNVFIRKIMGVEGIRSSQPEKMNVGLLIKNNSDEEIERLRNWEPRNTIAIILKSQD